MLASLTIFTVLATKARDAGCGHSKRRVRQGMCKGASLRLSAAEHPGSGRKLGESGSFFSLSGQGKPGSKSS